MFTRFLKFLKEMRNCWNRKSIPITSFTDRGYSTNSRVKDSLSIGVSDKCYKFCDEKALKGWGKQHKISSFDLLGIQRFKAQYYKDVSSSHNLGLHDNAFRIWNLWHFWTTKKTRICKQGEYVNNEQDNAPFNVNGRNAIAYITEYPNYMFIGPEDHIHINWKALGRHLMMMNTWSVK
jgi:hypothetical protein